MQKTSHDMLILQSWFSPAFPVGAFSYSHGLEAAIQKDLVTDAPHLNAWIGHLIEQGSARNEALFIRAAYQGEEEANALCLCLCAGRERQQETLEMGRAFTKAVQAAYDLTLESDLAYPVALGQAATRLRLDPDLTVHSYLHAFASNLISIGIRSIPIGQSAGQSCLVKLIPLIEKVAESLQSASLNDLGSAAFVSDLMSIIHEQSSPRIYRT